MLRMCACVAAVVRPPVRWPLLQSEVPALTLPLHHGRLLGVRGMNRHPRGSASLNLHSCACSQARGPPMRESMTRSIGRSVFEPSGSPSRRLGPRACMWPHRRIERAAPDVVLRHFGLFWMVCSAGALSRQTLWRMGIRGSCARPCGGHSVRSSWVRIGSHKKQTASASLSIRLILTHRSQDFRK